MKKALIFGVSGTLGTKLVKKLKSKQYWVRGVDLNEISDDIEIDEFIQADLTKESSVMTTMFSDTMPFDEVYQFVVTDKDVTADSIVESLLINIHTLKYARRFSVGKVLALSSGDDIYKTIYSLWRKEKKVLSLVMDIDKKKTTKAFWNKIDKEITKDNKKALKKLGNVEK